MKNTQKNDYRTDNVKRERDKAILLESIISRIKTVIKMLPLIFIGLLFAAIIIQLTVIASTNAEKTKYLQQTDTLERDMATRMDEVNDGYVLVRLSKILTQNDLYMYANSFWEYSLTVNGVPVDDEVVDVEAEGQAVEIVLTEKRTENPLPDSIIMVGSVTRGDKTDKIERHILVTSSGTNIMPVVSEKHEGVITKTYTYGISGAASGDKILMTLSDQLVAKVNMPFTEIEINVG